MGAALALVRASWLTARTYRVNLLLSLVYLPVLIVPVFYISRAVQSVAEDAIRTQGGQYFGFVLLGMITFSFVSAAVNGLPAALAGGVSTGTLEALLATPVRLPVLLAGLTGYNFVWTTIRALLMLGIGLALGARIEWARAPVAVAILALIVAAHVGFGVLGAAMTLAFRTAGPLGQAVIVASSLLGGVYWPTDARVIPDVIRGLSDFVPLTYGLRALRQTLLEGAGLAAIAPDVAKLTGIAMLLLGASALGFRAALRYARRAGTLAQY
ncbi:MAG TPA: ABC transporter permease [Gemmatimonadaceae bacterium]|nr:ABC transporter permease [Gemmatimonadaceae bacterium]